MLRRGFRRLNWHGLQEFAIRDADAAAFRLARQADGLTSETISQESTAPKIDWAKFSSDIQHKDLVASLKQYVDEQSKILDTLAAEDHAKAAKDSRLNSWEAVYQDAVSTAHAAVQSSEEIVANGAKALYISYNNPPIHTVSTQEWLDVDQYWQAFVEKHQYYHNHLDCTSEDPESKEYDEKVKMEMMQNFRLHDESHPRTKLLYQRPSYEYYSYFKGVLVEHMMFYLAKTGGDARLFPETMPHSWYNRIYETKFKLVELLQKRRRSLQETTLARELDLEFTPHDLVGGGEAYYAKLIAKENTFVEAQVARLMGDFAFLSEGIPVQSASALKACTGGKCFSLGDDVNAIFFVPDSAPEDSPAAACTTFLKATQGKMHPIYDIAVSEFASLLEERKKAFGGTCWFNAPGETRASAFMRRVKADDPLKPVFAEYVQELEAKWAAKTELSADAAATRIKQIEAQAAADGAAFTEQAVEVLGGTESLTSTFAADPEVEAKVRAATPGK